MLIDWERKKTATNLLKIFRLLSLGIYSRFLLVRLFMTPKTKIKISRNGVDKGEYELWQIALLIKTGEVLSTDHYWHEGMTEWKMLSGSEIIALAVVAENKIKEAATQRYICNLCQLTFTEPMRFDGGGCAVLLLFILAGGIAILFTAQMLIGISLVLIILCLIICVSLFSIKQPSCPKCNSVNISLKK